MPRKDLWKEYSGDFKNEADFEEEIEDEMLDEGEVERMHFEEDEYN